MYVFFIRTKYMYNEENTPLCKWNEQQKSKVSKKVSINVTKY